MSGCQKNKDLQRIKNIIISYCKDDIFSACSLAFSDKKMETYKKSSIYYGTTGSCGRVKIDNASLFDLASLTKPLVTLLSLLTLIEQEKLRWSDTLEKLLFLGKPHIYKDVTLFHLASHSSGLPAHRAYWPVLETIDSKMRRQWLIDQIVSEKKEHEAGKEHLYSDLGYILLGFLIEEKTGKDLACYWNEVVAEPLGVASELLFPGLNSSEKRCFVATSPQKSEREPGVVDDDNCRIMGGICGHAGLFGTAAGVLRICQELLDIHDGKKARLQISPQTLNKACSRVGTSDWTAGFNMPSRTGSSSGRYFSSRTVGHLGFTGTSFWIDLEEKLAVALLTNRVIKGDNMEGIRMFRPLIHDAVVEYLRQDKVSPSP